MPGKNSSQRKRKAKIADTFRILKDPVVLPNNLLEKAGDESERLMGVPRFHGAPILFAIARDPRTIFIYWNIDWPAMFAETAPVDRQVHLRVHRADGIQEESVAVEPMAVHYSISVSRPNGSYRVEIGYYQPADVWNCIATSEEVTMPPDVFADHADADLATIPLHLSFQRLLDLFGESKPDALAETISQFQTRALSNEKSSESSDQEQKTLGAMDLSLSEIAAARRAFIDEASIETLRKRSEPMFRFASTSPSRGFGESSRSSSAT
jgi:hypothetical protein